MPEADDMAIARQNEKRMKMESKDFHSDDSIQNKPLGKLVRVDNGRGVPRGKYEADPSEYHGKYEASPSEYHGRYEAPPRGKSPARLVRVPQNNEGIPQNEPIKKKKVKKSKKEKKREKLINNLVKTASVLIAVVVSMVLVLNMPILVDRKNGGNISLITYFKNWQPAAKEGELNKENVKLDLLSDDEKNPDELNFNDGLDLPQLIEGQYSILFLGFDDEEFNTDVVWVVQLDIGHGGINILQIPRDTCLPDYTRSVTRKFNSIYSMGDPNIQPPIQRTVNAVQENFGIPIDAYITTACFDIVEIVDLIGGIPITIENEIIYEHDKIIPEGDITLTGAQAEWFIRFRREWMQGDIGRMQNQRKFMAAAMQKLFSIVKDEGRLKLYSYIKEIYEKELVYTDLSIGDLSKVADFASNIDMENVRVDMIPGEDAVFYAADGNGYSVFSVHKQETIDLLNNYYRPYQKRMTQEDTSMVELVLNHQYDLYDDTGATLEEIEDTTEPMRDPSMKPWWKED